MPKLILIKHAAPLVDPAKSSDLWRLSEAGREQAGKLAEQLRDGDRGAGLERRAEGEGDGGDCSGRRCGEGGNVARVARARSAERPHMRSRDFISMVELFFRKPGERVLGSESANEALRAVYAGGG